MILCCKIKKNGKWLTRERRTKEGFVDSRVERERYKVDLPLFLDLSAVRPIAFHAPNAKRVAETFVGHVAARRHAHFGAFFFAGVGIIAACGIRDLRLDTTMHVTSESA